MRIKRLFEDNLNLQELDKKDLKTNQTRGQKLVNKLKSDQDFTIDKKTKICPNCDGKGKVLNPDYDETDTSSESEIKCKECNGSGEKKQRLVKKVNFSNNQDVLDQITTDDVYDKDKAKDFFKPTKNYKEVLKGEDNKDYKLNDIKKDEYFGSGRGSSLGIEKTRQVESLQCLFFALKQNLGNIEIDKSHIEKLYDGRGQIKPEILQRVKVPIDITSDFVREFISTDNDKWVETFINTSNALFKQDLQIVGKRNRTVFKKEKVYNFHQIGADTELIKAILVAYDNPETKGIPISKWTPSDVWAIDVTKEQNIVYKLRTCGNVKELNDEINTRFLRSQLIGVSLKKIGGADKIGLVINKLTPPPKFKFNEIITSTSPLGSTGLRLVVNYESPLRKGKNSMYLRSFSGIQSISNISGEIEGLYSRYGKIGLTVINQILMECGVITDDLIPTASQIQMNRSYTDEFLKAEITRLNELIPSKSRLTQKRITERASLISKYQSLRFAEILLSFSNDDYFFEDEDEDEIETQVGPKQRVVDKIVEDMFYYALAIKNYQFECPMYVRIISE